MLEEPRAFRMPRRERGRHKRSRRQSSSSDTVTSSSSSSSSSSDERHLRKRSKRRRHRSPKVSQNVLLSSVIPEFDPLSDDVDMWLNVVQANAISFGWRDEMVKYQALQKLRSTAKTWYDSLLKNETKWTSWKWKDWRNKLSDTFQIKRNIFLLLKQLLETKPSDGQSLYEFYFQQKSKIDKLRLGFSENDIISIIVGTIGDTQLCNAAQAGSFKYCDDLASFLHGKTQPDAANANQPTFDKKYVSTPKTRFDTKPNGSHPQPSTSNQLNNSRSLFTCYRCGEVGHRRTDCTVKDNVKCDYCLKLGHLEVACRLKSLKTKPEKNPEVKLVSSEKQKFFKNALVDDKPCTAFIDMGSDCSLIVPSLVNKLGLQTRELDKHVNLTGFTNSITIKVNKVVESRLKIDKVELMVTMYVIDSLSDCELLIGRNFTENKNIMYSRIGDTLAFDNATLQVSVIDTPNLDVSCAEHENVLKNLFNKYPKCVSNDFSTLGKTSSVELEIDLTTSKPVYQRPYRMSEQEKVITREIVEDLLQNHIIRPSNSSYASPALLVDKSSGEKRLCIDYRQLNKITVKEKYPMPMIEDLIDRLRGCSYYTSLDLKSGYYHIPIKEQDIHKTAFVTSDGHYEFTRMPFGLCNGPAVFQRLMDTVLGNHRFGKIICYMDDLLIATDSLTENISCLEEVLKILSEHGLTLNLKKCSFFQKKINFLGYEISKEGIRPSSKKVKAVQNYPTPTNVHELRQFLGLINYFRKFIKDCALLSKPLTNLLKKDVTWCWNAEHDEAVVNLKNALVDNAVLNIFDPKLPTNLYTDASREGLAMILMQVTESGEKPIHFYSRQTSREEKAYHSFELELLAIVVGLEKFRHYLLGANFKIITDCNAVKHALTKKDIIPRISRWVLRTQEFSFEIVHRAGSQMQHVDALSRNPVKLGNEVDSFHINNITEGDWLLSVQLQDPSICSIRDILKSGEAEQHKQIFDNYELLGNKVYKRTEYGRRWLVPKQCIWQIIRLNHDNVGHFAVDKTVERIRSLYWFPRLKNTVKKYIKNCLNCIYYKNIHGKKPGQLYPIPKYARPFHTLHLDHLGPFVKSTQNKCYLLVIVDSFTKFVFIAATNDTKSKRVVNELDKIFKIFGNPKRVICDAGSAFTSKSFTKYCEDKAIRRHIIATAVPRSNGQVERYNGTILEALRSMGADTDNDKWDQHIDKIQQGINSTINKTTAAVPSEVFFGYRLRMDGDVDDHNEERSLDVTKLREQVDSKIKLSAEKQKAAFDSKRKVAPNYQIGDLVVIKVPSYSNGGQSTKLMAQFKGPFQITEILGHDRYRVQDMRGSERSSKLYNGITCVENMKPWIRLENSEI